MKSVDFKISRRAYTLFKRVSHMNFLYYSIGSDVTFTIEISVCTRIYENL